MAFLSPDSMPPGPWQREPFADLQRAPEPRTPQTWLRRADIALSLLEDPELASAAVTAGLAACAAGKATPHTAAAANNPTADPAGVELQLRAIEVGLLVATGQPGPAEQALRRRICLIRESGYRLWAQVEEQLGLKLYGLADARDLPPVQSAFSAAIDADDAEAVCTLASVLVRLLWQSDRRPEALAVAERTLQVAPRLRDAQRYWMVQASYGALYEYSGDVERSDRALKLLMAALESGQLLPSFRTLALRSVAAIAAVRGWYRRAGTAADHWAQLAFEAGARAQLIEAWLLAASFYSQLDDDAGAAVRAQLALEVASELPPAEQRRIRFTLGQYLMWSGRSAESAACFAALHKDELAAGTGDSSLAQTLLWYARAAEQAHNLPGAAAARDEAIAAGQRSGGLEVVAEAALDATRMYLLSDSPQALEYAELAVATARRLELPGLLVPALEHRGRAKAFRADPEALGDFDEAVELALAHEQDWLAADAADSKGRFLAAMGRVDESVQVLFSAADAFAAAGDQRAAAMSELAAARSLRVADRADDVVVALQSCLDRLTAMEAAGELDAGAADSVKAEFDAGH